jgi:hypothetical protein
MQILNYFHEKRYELHMESHTINQLRHVQKLLRQLETTLAATDIFWDGFELFFQAFFWCIKKDNMNVVRKLLYFPTAIWLGYRMAYRRQKREIGYRHKMHKIIFLCEKNSGKRDGERQRYYFW